jgi:hypothetical protein
MIAVNGVMKMIALVLHTSLLVPTGIASSLTTNAMEIMIVVTGVMRWDAEIVMKTK